MISVSFCHWSQRKRANPKEKKHYFSNFSLFAEIQSNVDSLQREIRSMKTAVKGYVRHFKVRDRVMWVVY